MILLLAAGSGAAALIYEMVWFQLLELVVGSTAVSLGMLLATFMGGHASAVLSSPRLVLARRDPLKVYTMLEAGIGALGVMALLLIPLAGRVYTGWSGSSLQGFLLRGAVGAACLLPPTFLMGATMPALSRTIKISLDTARSAGVIYAFNIAGAVLGCLFSGFYLLRLYGTSPAAYVAVAINFAIAAIAFTVSKRGVASSSQLNVPVPAHRSVAAPIYIAIALSGFCALGSEAIWTRTVGLLFGASVYTFSVVLAVFLAGLGIGSGLGSLLARTIESPGRALGYCQLLAAVGMVWAAHAMNRWLPYWPNPALSSDDLVHLWI